MNITLKDVPPELHERLKTAAEETGRSLNRQIIYTLEQALSPKRMEPAALVQRIQKRRDSIGGVLDRDRLRESIDEGRP